jgi:P27 family predicted phage terminase small subunit
MNRKSIEKEAKLRGRKPRTAAQQIAEGDPSKRGVHKLDAMLESEPKATRGLPECPQHLKGIARKAWRFWAEELEEMSLDCRPDAMMLEACCVSYQTYVEMYELIEQQGKLVAKKERNPQTGQLEVVDVRPHPALVVRDRSLMQMKAFCSEFGLSPVSRARLFVERREADGDDLMALLAQPRQRRASTGETVQ